MDDILAANAGRESFQRDVSYLLVLSDDKKVVACGAYKQAVLSKNVSNGMQHR